MTDIWRRGAADDASSIWRFSSWIPHAVIVNLGSNDFASGIPNQHAFTEAYLQLLRDIRARYGPETLIICTLGPILFGGKATLAREYVTAVMKTAKATGDVNLVLLEFPMLSIDLGTGAGAGCGSHPHVHAHAAMADAVAAVLHDRLHW